MELAYTHIMSLNTYSRSLSGNSTSFEPSTATTILSLETLYTIPSTAASSSSLGAFFFAVLVVLP